MHRASEKRSPPWAGTHATQSSGQLHLRTDSVSPEAPEALPAISTTANYPAACGLLGLAGVHPPMFLKEKVMNLSLIKTSAL